MVSESGSVAESAAPLIVRRRRGGPAHQGEEEGVVEISSETVRSVQVRAGGSVTSRRRCLRRAAEVPPPQAPVIAENLIAPVGEGEEALCCSGSLDFSEFDFLSDEVIPEVPSDDNEVDEVDCSLRLHEYLTLHPPENNIKSTRVRSASIYKAKDVDSVVSEVDLFIWRDRFQVPSDVHFWVSEHKVDYADQPPEGCITMNYDTMAAGVRFPLHPIISKLLNFWGLAPTQITPNGWSTIMGLLSLFGRVQPRAFLSAKELNFVTSLARWEKDVGYYYVKSRPHMKIIEDLPNKFQDWKEKWWFVGGGEGAWQSPVFDLGFLGYQLIPCDYAKFEREVFLSYTFVSTDLTLSFLCRSSCYQVIRALCPISYPARPNLFNRPRSTLSICSPEVKVLGASWSDFATSRIPCARASRYV